MVSAHFTFPSIRPCTPLFASEKQTLDSDHAECEGVSIDSAVVSNFRDRSRSGALPVFSVQNFLWLRKSGRNVGPNISNTTRHGIVKIRQHVVLVDRKPLAEDWGAAPLSFEILGGQKFLGPPIFLGPLKRCRRHFNSADRTPRELQTA